MTSVLSGADRASLRERLIGLYTPCFTGISRGPAHIRQMADDSLDEERSAAFVQGVCDAVGADLRGRRMLEVGAGVGLGVAVARRRFGIEATGVEPGAAEYGGTLEVAHDILARAGLPREAVVEGVGEALPFPDASFDVVVSSNVLEHVGDPQKVLDEMARVVRPGGHLVVVVPNYGSWWEGHYGVLWLPHMPLWLAKLYIGLRGRDTDYLDTLTFVTPGKLRRWLRPHAGQLEVLDWGVDLFRRRLETLDFNEYSALGRLKRMLRMLHRIGVIPLLSRVAVALEWQTPIVLTARRRSGAE